MKKLIRSKVLQDICLLFFLSLTPLFWFKNGAILVGHDNVFPLNPIIFFSGRLFTWIDQGFGRSQSLIMGTIPIHFIDSLPAFFHIPLQIDEMIVYVFWFFCMLLSAYIFAHAIKPDSRVFKMTASIFYVFNFFILQGWFIGERTKFSAYIAMPLLLTIFLKVYKGRLPVLLGVSCAALILFLFNAGGLYGIPLYGGAIIALGTFIFFHVFVGIFKKRFHAITRIFFLTVLTCVSFLLINAYYLFPAFSGVSNQYNLGIDKSGGASGIIDWATEISANTSISNLLRLQGISEWYDNAHHPYAKYYLHNPLLIVISFLFPLIIFLTLVKVRKKSDRELILFFFFTFLFGIVLAGGTHPPLGFIYEVCVRYIPGFSIFRSPYFKFAPAIFLGASFLTAYFFDSLTGKVRRYAFAVFIILLLLYHFPFFTGNFFNWRPHFATRLQIPQYVFEFGNWMNNEKPADSRILLLPQNSPNLQYSLYTWGYFSFWGLPQLFSNGPAIINNDRVTDEERFLLTSLYNALAKGDTAKSQKFLSLLDIKYILLQHDTYASSEFPNTVNSKVYADAITKTFHFPRIKKFGAWDLYQISDSKQPIIFTSTGMNFISGTIDQTTDYTDFNETEDLFVLKNDNQFQNSDVTEHILANDFYLPDCLTCPDKNKPEVKFADRAILPNSFLYPLVLFMEKRSQNIQDPKGQIYSDIGISLKRAVEIHSLARKNEIVTQDTVSRYQAVLMKMRNEFLLLTNLSDKLHVADDITYYLNAEQNYLSQDVGTVLTGDQSVSPFGSMFQSIAQVKNTVAKDLFSLDATNNRLYEFALQKKGTYILSVNSDAFQGSFPQGLQVTSTIDNAIIQQATINAGAGNSWSSFETTPLEKGNHTLLISFPPPPNLAADTASSPVPFTITSDSSCYLTHITDFDAKKTYRLKIFYKNNFSTDLYAYTWQQENGMDHLLNLSKLKTSLSNETFEEIIKSDDTVKNVFIGICAKNLTSDVFTNGIQIIVNEIIYPKFIFVPAEQKPITFSRVSFKKINPTKYTISLTNSNRYEIVEFMEEFDSGWILSGFAGSHFRLNGYANGWIIDKKGHFDLTLSYKPQNNFYKGIVVSVITCIACISFLLFFWYKRRTYD